ncbi:peptide ABC transporter substrate-binding protein [Candidatus Protochlamydia phocaeensis]|uniref:peptide ABC transporter substrate-binding protein n=1 Tax=Candidatus Protochlamydia phocaeensis TaxID=1414722 RepID=UPI0008380169|nr:peptide ABC transporter substrate-binding protein [Candidatus Protochlamydia phocaeensis]
MVYKLSLFLFLFTCALICAACRPEKPVADQKVLRISCEGDPQTLDPRQVRDLATATTMHLLYEGLMRNQADGQPALALADSMTLSPDQKTYTFKLRKSAWTNGQPVTAYDFEQSWKSTLDPAFPSPNAYQLYVIKGAQGAKEGKSPLDQIGIHALDPETLVVELEAPTPYFPHLLTTYFYFPVHETLRNKKTAASQVDLGVDTVTNGPFQLEKWARHNELSVKPNPHYWDRSAVRLDKLTFVVSDNPTALKLFQNHELDWTGSPLSTLPTDALMSLKQTNHLQVMPAAGVYLFRLNIEKPPFDHPKIRQAMALALNRQELVEHALQGNQIPAMGLIPPSFLASPPFFQDHATQKARQLLQEALTENQMTLQDLAPISLCYAGNERSHKIAQVAQQQWKTGLGIDVRLQSCESKVFFDRLKKQDYQISIGSWFADIRDPISFLDVFKFKNNGTNNTQWENPRYIELLARSSQTADSTQRAKLLKDAEAVLMQDMPIIPLFYASYNYLKAPGIKGVYFSELGYLDFKKAELD